MEWVERTDRTVEAAKDFLLDQLGVDEDEAEFEILEEPKPGLFGRVKGQARVRARVAPRAPRSKDDRRRRSNRKSSGGRDQGGSDRQKSAAKAGSKSKGSGRTRSPQQEAGVKMDDRTAPQSTGAQESGAREEKPDRVPEPKPASGSIDTDAFIPPLVEFLDQLVTAFGLDGTASVEIVDGELEARIVGDGLGALIGPSGAVINAVQELARTFLQKVAKGGTAPRLRVDVGGYRAERRAALAEFAKEVAASVLETGRPHAFEPMGSVDRKVIHDAAAEVDGVATRSEGDDQERHVVMTPA